MATYSPSKLEGYADGLEAKFVLIVALYCIIPPVLTLVALFVYGFVFDVIVKLDKALAPLESLAIPNVWVALSLVILALCVGAISGYSRANKYRIQAQMILCSVQQESHLRRILEEVNGKRVGLQ